MRHKIGYNKVSMRKKIHQMNGQRWLILRVSKNPITKEAGNLPFKHSAFVLVGIKFQKLNVRNSSVMQQS